MWIYPFSAILGQERLKTALILCAANPDIGGVLVQGQKGTAKSTAVRALAGILPEIETIYACQFNCDPAVENDFCPVCKNAGALNAPGKKRIAKRAPIVTLPLNATEDRVAGGLDFEKALRTGGRAFAPGLLAAAHRGILYVDEVNLLDDFLADLILDAAATGMNRVEREGVSFVHPARFVLVGTMNPEEGSLRPQFLDRFGLCVEVDGEADPGLRVALMERREAFDADPKAFCALFDEQERALAGRISRAGEMLEKVVVGQDARKLVVEQCRKAGVAGHRADIVMEKTAKTIAAWEGRTFVDKAAVLLAASFVLPHRIREAANTPQKPPPPPQDDRERENEPPADEPSKEPPPGDTEQDEHPDSPQERLPLPPPPLGQDKEQVFAIGPTFGVRRIRVEKDRISRRGPGRRSRTRSAEKKGRYVKSRMAQSFSDLALDATLRAAAPFQKQRKGASALAVQIRRQDIHTKVREKRMGHFLVFLVDGSGSMGAQKRMAAAKGAVMSLLLDAYRMRDLVSVVVFRKKEASLALPPTNSVALAARPNNAG